MENWFRQPLPFIRPAAVRRMFGIRGTRAHPTGRRRLMAMALAVCVIFTAGPQTAYASVSAPDTWGGGVCEHHPSHSNECGYAEGSGSPCSHLEHTGDCFKTVKHCLHAHEADCYASDAAISTAGELGDPVNCLHVCSEENGCITSAADCPHEKGKHDNICGYEAETGGEPCTYLCNICSEAGGRPPKEEEPVCTCTEQCTEDRTNEGCLVCERDIGSCIMAAALPFTLLSGDAITVKVNGREVKGANLSAAVTASNVALGSIKSIEVTAGAVVAEDWTWFKTNREDIYMLTTLTIEDTVDSAVDIPAGEAYYRGIFPNRLENVDIAKVDKIGNYAFLQESGQRANLETVKFSDVTSIGEEAFRGCTSLTKAEFPEAVIIWSSAFWECESLAEIDFPRVWGIGDHAFEGCKALTDISFPSAAGIGAPDGFAFLNCTSLISAKFPVVESMADDTFSGCTSLAALSLGAVPPETETHTFAGCPTTCEIKLVNEFGWELDETALKEAQSVYDRADSTDTDTALDGKWCGLKVREPAEREVEWTTGSETDAGPIIDAVTELRGKTGSIKLLDVVTEPYEIKLTDADTDITLDLNGKLLTGEPDTALSISEGASLTIDDSSAEKTGGVAGAIMVGIDGTQGSLTINSGTFTGEYYALSVSDTGTAVLNGGTFTSASADMGGAIVVNGFDENELDSAAIFIDRLLGTGKAFEPASAYGWHLGLSRDIYGTLEKHIAVVAAVIPPAGVTLNKDTLLLKTGESEVLTAVVTPAEAGNKTVVWSSDAPEAAAVDQQGRVTAIAAGEAVVTVTTAEGGFTATCAVSVSPKISGDGIGDIEGTVTDENQPDVPLEGVVVTLKKGGTHGTPAGEPFTTKADGSFKFTAIPYGSYSLVAARGGRTGTKAIVVNSPETGADIVMLSGSKDTEVQVKDGTPSVAADNLDEMFTPEDNDIANGSGTVMIRLLIEEKAESEVQTDADIAKRALPSSEAVIGVYIDARLLKTISIGSDISENEIQPPQGKRLKLILDLPSKLWDKAPYSVIRVHDNTAKTLPAVYDPLLHTLTFDADAFSTYAVVYTTASVPVDPVEPADPPNHGGRDHAPLLPKPPYTGVATSDITRLAPAPGGKADEVTITKEIAAAALGRAADKAMKSGTLITSGIELVMEIEGGGNQGRFSINLPKETQELLITNHVRYFTIRLAQMSVHTTLDLEAVKAIHSQANADVQLSVNMLKADDFAGAANALIGEGPVYNITAAYRSENQNKTITDLGQGSMTTAVLYRLTEGEKAESIRLARVENQGGVTWLDQPEAYDAALMILQGSSHSFGCFAAGVRNPE